jgi:hypothetical protein
MVGMQTAAGERQVSRQLWQQQHAWWQVGRQQQESAKSARRWAVAVAPGKNCRYADSSRRATGQQAAVALAAGKNGRRVTGQQAAVAAATGMVAGRQTEAGVRQVNMQVGCGSGGRQELQVCRQQQESDRSTGSCGSGGR